MLYMFVKGRSNRSASQSLCHSLGSLALLVLLSQSALAVAEPPEDYATRHARAVQLLDQTFPLTTTPDAQLKPLSEEALALARGLRDRKLEAQALWHLGYAYLKGEQYPRALELFYQSRSIYSNIGNQADVSILNLQIGHLFRFHLGDYPTAMAYYRQACESARKQPNPLYVVRALTFTGNLFQDLGEQKLAAAALTEALPYSESLPGVDGAVAQGVLHLELAKIYLQLNDLERAATSIRQARASMALLPSVSEHTRSRIEVVQGHLLRQSGRFEEAKEAYRRANDMRGKENGPRDVANLLCDQAETERQAGQLALALEHFQQARSDWLQMHDMKGVCETSLAIGRIMVALGSPKEALAPLEECLRLSEANGFHMHRKEVYQVLSEAHGALHDPAKALEYRRLFDEWKDRVFGAVVAIQVAGILNKYEKNRLDREILHLQRQNRWGLAGISVLAMFIAVGFILRLRGFRKQSDIPINSAITTTSTPSLSTEQNASSYDRSKHISTFLTQEQAKSYLIKLKNLMEQDQLYLDPELSLDTLSKKLRINSRYLSQLINTSLGQPFKDYLNELRFEAAKKMLRDPAQAKRTVLEIGFEAGFKSKSNFYRVFKQTLDMTPIEYREEESKKGVA